MPRLFFILALLVGVLLVVYALNSRDNSPVTRQYRHQFLTMGTQATIIVDLPVAQLARLQSLLPLLEERVRVVENLMSRFKDDSDIARFNRAEAGEMIAVNPLTWLALLESARVNELSNGAFDITVLPLMKLYDWKNRDIEKFPSADAINEALTKVGMDKIIWQREGMKIGKNVDGVEIDLGGVAKGLGVDLAAEFLRTNEIKNAIVDIGGEQKILGKPSENFNLVQQKIGGAEHENHETHQGNLWTTGIRDPRAAENIAQILRARADCALATSGDYEKFFVYQNKRYSHILDPRTGLPLSGGIISATVIVPESCMQADALATAVSVLGVEKAREMFNYFPHAQAWLVLEDNSVLHLPPLRTKPLVNE